VFKAPSDKLLYLFPTLSILSSHGYVEGPFSGNIAAFAW
jgi:hypothetical protein